MSPFCAKIHILLTENAQRRGRNKSSHFRDFLRCAEVALSVLEKIKRHLKREIFNA